MNEVHPFFNHPFIVSLCSFEHSPKTDIAKRRVNNKDFITLCIFVLGPLSAAELRILADAWRGQKRVLDAYFIPHYGHTADDIEGCHRFGGDHCSTRLPKFWWRRFHHAPRIPAWAAQTGAPKHLRAAKPMQAFRNDLTKLGLERVRKLLRCPNESPLQTVIPVDHAFKTREVMIEHIVAVLNHDSAHKDGVYSIVDLISSLAEFDPSKCDIENIFLDQRVQIAVRSLIVKMKNSFNLLAHLARR